MSHLTVAVISAGASPPAGFAKLGAEEQVAKHVAETAAVAEAAAGQPGSRRAYDYVAINPVVVFGPCLTKAHTKASPSFLRDFLFGNPKPDAWITVVDVREVALAHVVALQVQRTLHSI